jgi:signal transduction histidine kinase
VKSVARFAASTPRLITALLRVAALAIPRFIALAAHELRTPLTVIQGYLGMVVDAQAEQRVLDHEEMKVIINGIGRGVSRLNGIVSESIYPKLSKDYGGIPIRNFYFDGTQMDLENDLGIFMELVHNYSRRKTKRRLRRRAA